MNILIIKKLFCCLISFFNSSQIQSYMYVSVMHFHLNITHIHKNIITFFNQTLTQNKHKSVYRVNKAKAQSIKFPTSNYFNINLLAIHITCSYVTTIKSLAKKIDGKSPFRVHTQLSSWGQW